MEYINDNKYFNTIASQAIKVAWVNNGEFIDATAKYNTGRPSNLPFLQYWHPMNINIG